MKHNINLIIMLMESIALNYSTKSRHDRKYLRSRLKTLKLALRECFEWELTKGQATIIKGELRYLRQFKLGSNGKLHYNGFHTSVFKTALSELL
jgi:hypothetical protein